MSIKRLEYKMQNRDPKKVAELQAIIDEAWPVELAELRELFQKPKRTPPPPAPRHVTDRSTTQWIKEANGQQRSDINRDEQKMKKMALTIAMMDITSTPQARAEEDAHETEQEKQRAAVHQMLRYLQGGKDTTAREAIHEAYDGRLNFGVPKRETDED